MSLFDRRRKDDGTAPPPSPATAATAKAAEPTSVPEDASDTASLLSRPANTHSKTSGEGSTIMANIGKSITIKGDLSGNEDLVVEGNVEGKIELPSNQLTIGAEGNASAQIHAQSVVIIGKVTGNVSATERIEIQASGFVDGDVKAPRLVVEEGAVLNGSISMEGPGSAPRSTAKTDTPGAAISPSPSA